MLTYNGDPSAFDGKGWALVRINATAPFEVEHSTTFELGIPIAATETASLVGLDASGNLVVRMRTLTSPMFQTFDATSLEPIEAATNQIGIGANACSQFLLSPDGQRMIRWNDTGLWIVNTDPDAVEQQVVLEGVRNAWFVGVAAL